MAKQKTIFFLGIWVAILPFLGFPSSWKQIFFLITGAALAYLGYLLNRESAHHTHDTKTSYIESKPMPEIGAQENN